MPVLISYDYNTAMELKQLRTFEMAVRYGSFTRVARELGLSQPAVSGQIQALEQELGVKLLERQPRQVLLTSAGEVLLPYARRLLNLEAEATAAMAELEGAEATCLRLAASPTIGAYLLPAMLGEFKRHHQSVRIIAEVEPTHRVVEALQAHAIDVGLVEAAVDSSELVVGVFFSDELVLIVPAGHAWADRCSITPQELAQQPLLTREPESGTRALVEEALAALGVRITPALELGGVEAIKNAVIAGLGVSFVSRQAIRLEEKLGALVAVEVEGLDLCRPLYYVHNKHRHMSALLKSFLELLQAASKRREMLS
ncbi:MAG: LysR substrate-binding domain-containing protein [Anaerolineae bacterium]